MQGHIGVLLDEQYRHALLVHGTDNVEDTLHHQRRQAQRRLIQHQQLGTAHQGPPHSQHLLLAAGQGAGILLHALLQAGKMREHHVHRQVGEHPPPLGGLGDARLQHLVDGLAQQLLPIVGDGTAVRLYKARDGAQRGGFTGAVGADERYDLAVRHLQTDAPQGTNAAVGHVEIINLQHRLPPPDKRQ